MPKIQYYYIWRQGYDFYAYAHKGKYVLMGIYAALLYVFFQNSDCTMFGQLNRVDLVIGQIISLAIVNALTYLQLCLIGNEMLELAPMAALFGIQTVIAQIPEEPDVVGDGAAEQPCILEHHREVVAQLLSGEFSDVTAVN